MPAPLAERVRGRLLRDLGKGRARIGSAWRHLRTPPVTGVVEKLGRREIVGWIDVPKGTGQVRVGLWLGTAEVTSVVAVRSRSRNTNAEIRTFRFAIRDLWNYAHKTDQLSVRVNGRPLPFADRGMFYRPRNDGAHTLAELRAMLGRGYVFASNGQLLLAKNRDTAWQGAVMSLYQRVRAGVQQAAGYDVFLIYGSLLGAVREHGFIGHDFDLDAAFVSAERDPAAVGLEMSRIARALIDQGLDVETRVTALHVHEPGSKTRIDLFHLFFDASGVLQFPFGAAGAKPFTVDQWRGVQEIALGGSTALIPHNAEALVETLYGGAWRTPNSGFSWERERRQRTLEGRIPVKPAAEVNWENFYTYHRFDQPSPFFEAVIKDESLPRAVVDLGCGDGRDTVAFAAAGRPALGVDVSEVGLRRAAERAARLPAEVPQPGFERCDFDDVDRLRSVLAAAAGERAGAPVLYYGRFLLHALFDDTKQALLGVLDELARPGDWLAVEFRTPADQQLPKRFSYRHRRYIDPADLVGLLTDRLGFEVAWQDGGTGLSPFENEDPELHRVVACRSR
jgi:SAM-dependent methyltransferase